MEIWVTAFLLVLEHAAADFLFTIVHRLVVEYIAADLSIWLLSLVRFMFHNPGGNFLLVGIMVFSRCPFPSLSRSRGLILFLIVCEVRVVCQESYWIGCTAPHANRLEFLAIQLSAAPTAVLSHALHVYEKSPTCSRSSLIRLHNRWTSLPRHQALEKPLLR